MTSEYVRGSSEWWLERLGRKLAVRAHELQRFDDYYSGIQGQRFIGTKYRELYAKLFERYCENFCGIVIDAVAERLEVTGFRFPSPAGDEPPAPPEPATVRGTTQEPVDQADRDAWQIWQDNGLDAGSQIAHTESLVKGVVYVMVSPFQSEFVAGRSPRITIEDARQTIVEYRAGSRERTVGMKRWWDDEAELLYSNLYFPDRIEKWRADARHTEQTIQLRSLVGEKVNWIRREVPGEAWPLAHDLGVVPLIPLVNRPRLSGEGRSEIADVIPIQDAINKLSSDELVASEAASFPQKWATGIEIPKGDDGKDLEPWKPDIDRILSTAVPDAKFGQFMPADLNQWGEASDRKVKRIASITQTPYHYFLDHGGQPPSGDSIKSSETGLVRKTRAKHRHLGEGWEEVERLSFKAMGDARSEGLDSETIWANPESLSEAEHVDALVKLKSIDVPEEQLWADAGYSPAQIERFAEMRARAPEPPAPTPPTPPTDPMAAPPAAPTT